MTTSHKVLEQTDQLLRTFDTNQSNNPSNINMPLHANKSKLNVEAEIDRIIKNGLFEDLSDIGDISTLSTIPKYSTSNAYLVAKANGIISGILIFERVMKTVDTHVKCEWLKTDGDYIKKGERIGNICGCSQSILTAERLALNILQRMSGIATQTHKMVQAMKAVKSRTILLDTRKTAPGLRIIDKMAVAHGGGHNHRMGLYDMILIKDNHICAAGGIKQAINQAVQYLNEFQQKNKNKHLIEIELECSTLEEVRMAVEFGANKIQRVMLDNMVVRLGNNEFDIHLLCESLLIINGVFKTEASGNIDLASIAKVASTNVDFVSSGAITHSVTAMDISLKFE